MTDNPDARLTPTLVLTRPEAQSRALATRFGPLARVIVSPIMEIRGIGTRPDLAPYAGIILTSANAVRRGPPLTGLRAHCVGDRTAQAARDAGAVIETIACDADDLVCKIRGPGPLLHLRGEHARGAVAERLNRAGIETEEAVIYRQVARPLTRQARDAIEGAAPAVLPLYSPRSARLVGDTVKPGPALHVIALSAAVARAWAEATGAASEVCDAPTGVAMEHRIIAALRRESP